MALESTFSILPITQVYIGRTIMQLQEELFTSMILAPLVTVNQICQKKNASFNFLGRIWPKILVSIFFQDNSANGAGSVLYGGAVDNCEIHGLDPNISGEVFDMIFHTEDNTNYNTTSYFSSGAVRTCPCENNLPKCGNVIKRNVYPGETFQVSVVALGQRSGTVPSTVKSTIYHGLGDLLNHQYHQQASKTCTKLNYTVFSLSQFVGLAIHAERSPRSTDTYIKQSTLNVSLYQTCPPGFNISESTKSCVCVQRLEQYTHQCIIKNLGQISSQHFWVGYDNLSNELILHPYCPFDYCVNDKVIFSLNSDVQCAHNRSALLCGCCKEGYSLVLGTSQCRKCTNSNLVLLIPFAVMGVVLVFLLLVCKLTVATGTLSGLLFYANIIGPNRTIFLPIESTNALSIFIAWLNLDFWSRNMFLQWTGHLQQNMATVCVPSIHLAASTTRDCSQPFLMQISKTACQQPSFCVGNSHSSLIY